MPSTDPNEPVVLTTVTNEPVASLLVARLRNEGIRSEMCGALTSDFRVEVPAGVQVLVRSEDAARARELLAAWHGEGTP